MRESRLGEAEDGPSAIYKLYEEVLRGCDESRKEQADGRYVAPDFYSGERVEAMVTGDWRVDMLLAPRAIAP